MKFKAGALVILISLLVASITYGKESKTSSEEIFDIEPIDEDQFIDSIQKISKSYKSIRQNNQGSGSQNIIAGSTASLDVSGNFEPGGSITFNLYAPNSIYPFPLPYVLAISVFGTSPGLSLPGGINFPLNPPYLFFLGQLNFFGQAHLSFPIPNDQNLVGGTISSAAATIDPFSPMPVPIREISNPVTFTIGYDMPFGNGVLGGCHSIIGLPFTLFASFNINLTQVWQFNQTMGVGNGSCGPASVASILEYYNRTRFPGIINDTPPGLLDQLIQRFNTTENGTFDLSIIRGLSQYLNERNLSRNFTFEWYGPNITGGGPGPIAATSNGVNVTIFNRAPNATDLINEFVTRNQTVIGLYHHTDGYDHYMPIDNIETNQNNPPGNYNISLMDPWVPQIIDGHMWPDGGLTEPDGNWTLRRMIAISPVS